MSYHNDWDNEEDDITFEILKGKILERIEGCVDDSYKVRFYCTDGTDYTLYHRQECCEDVQLIDVIGCVDDLIGHPILLANLVEEEGNVSTEEEYEADESSTWSFYNIATIKGTVTMRWYGTSNGYYSETVGFYEGDADD